MEIGGIGNWKLGELEMGKLRKLEIREIGNSSS
jgi:hypothetical protein